MTREDLEAGPVTLEQRVRSLKRRLLAMCKKARAGHIGGALSCSEILVFLKFAWMGEDDTLVLSKGHAVTALYSLLAETGALTQSQIDSYYEDGTQLPAHPPFNTFPEIPFATGSLGHGLSLCAGMALGARFKQQDRCFFCVTSDGELDEGSVWEAALFSAHHKLHNVVWVIDRNRIQGFGRTEEVLALEPLDAKLRAFGYHVARADGHDFRSLAAAREDCLQARASGRGPVVIIAETVKGHGMGSLQDTVDCHYLPMTDSQYEQALVALTLAHDTAPGGV